MEKVPQPSRSAVGTARALRIYKTYGSDAVAGDVGEFPFAATNPYSLAHDMDRAPAS